MACVCGMAQARLAPWLVRLARLRCHAAGLSRACCSVLGNDRSREAGGYHAHSPLRSPGERAGRDQEHRAWLTERKETQDATQSDHDP